VIATLAAIAAGGCTSVSEYVHNGFKVGPNYAPPQAPVARNWIDADDVRVRTQCDDLSKWWVVFKDPVLESLICDAYRQNLSLRVAGCRVLEARAQMLIDVGNLFPQTQTATGSYTRNAISRENANPLAPGLKRWYSQWNYGFNLSWELDFWGRLRRAIESDSASLDASVENYDDVLVTLLGDVATNYVAYRTAEQRIQYANENVKLQKITLNIAESRQRFGVQGVTIRDVFQAKSTMEQTQATIPELEIARRQAANQLCILLGIPPQDLRARLGSGSIPTAPAEVAAGIPANLLCRRPDVRRAERQAAAQSAQIGIAEAQFYPIISVNGTIGYSAQIFKDLFREQALTGSVGPSFTWNILNYGRIRNNVRLQDAHFQELVSAYQNTVLSAAQDVENGLVTFLRANEREKKQKQSVDDEAKAARVAESQYDAGATDVTTVTLLQQNLVGLEDTLAQAQGEIATGLIQVYRALGGGWQIRLAPEEGRALVPPPAAAQPAETIPAPAVPEPVAAPVPAPNLKPDRKPLP
jgi:NodT family efflux transporter outer membrane factor (OMF) lipoprotein